MRMYKGDGWPFKPLLPKTVNPECRELNDTIKCFAAGVYIIICVCYIMRILYNAIYY